MINPVQGGEGRHFHTCDYGQFIFFDQVLGIDFISY
jgi:hypothetical protein